MTSVESVTAPVKRFRELLDELKRQGVSQRALAGRVFAVTQAKNEKAWLARLVRLAARDASHRCLDLSLYEWSETTRAMGLAQHEAVARWVHEGGARPDLAVDAETRRWLETTTHRGAARVVPRAIAEPRAAVARAADVAVATGTGAVVTASTPSPAVLYAKARGVVDLLERAHARAPADVEVSAALAILRQEVLPTLGSFSSSWNTRNGTTSGVPKKTDGLRVLRGGSDPEATIQTASRC